MADMFLSHQFQVHPTGQNSLVWLKILHCRNHAPTVNHIASINYLVWTNFSGK